MSGEGRGWVYFVYCNGMIKVGQTVTSPRRRMGELQVGCPYPLELAATWCMSQYLLTRAERFLHDRFKSQQVLGEWFAVGPSALKAAKVALEEHLGLGACAVPAIQKKRKPRNNGSIDVDEMWDDLKIHINSEFHRQILTSAAISKRFKLAEIRRSLNESDDLSVTIEEIGQRQEGA